MRGRRTTNVNEQKRTHPENITEFPTSGIIPAARPLTDFAHERVGDDLILFDGETMQYHTLNSVAERIWRACDGNATIETIAAATELPRDVVETTIGELGEAALLQTPASAWSVPMNRRRAAKLIAAGAAGVVGVPVVLSLTAPSHQAAATHICGVINTSCSEPGHQAKGCEPFEYETYTCLYPTGSCQLGPLWTTSGTVTCT